MTFGLTKHHGLGNDFLILLTDDPDVAADARWPDRARAWCHRRTGVGADGLIIGEFGAAAPSDRPDGVPVDLRMTLYNADGSIAEISGNGLRCLVQAEARRRGVESGKLVVLTGGGIRTVEFEPSPTANPDVMVGRAEMGSAEEGPAPDRPPAPAGQDAVRERELALDAVAYRVIDVGNPHLVLRVDDPRAVVISDAGPLHESRWDGGINVHVVAPTPGEADAVDMVIWERGAGVTEACGSGATAVARAVHDWGLTGPKVTVHMPGGDAVVEVGDVLVLHGTATYVADVTVPEIAVAVDVAPVGAGERA
ncbi:MAG: diaminopimelate epimerase [Acidimicrobiales bacterium]|nr:diaminopimelate epimerase [Acidimicrobiales bacterium]